MKNSSIRELKSEEIVLVAGGRTQSSGTIVAAPPPPEPQLPPLPGVILSAR